MWNTILTPWLLLPALWLCFDSFMLLLIFLVSLLEKMMVWPYQPIDQRVPPADPTPDLAEFNPYAVSPAVSQGSPVGATPYSVLVENGLARFGFAPLGTCNDIRQGVYQVRYQFWLSRERHVLALVGSGTMLKIPFQATWLNTRLADGRFVVSLDNEKGAFFDLTRRTIEGLSPNADLAKLLAWHRDRVLATGVAVSPLTETDPLAAFRAFRIDRLNRLESAGLITYLDDQRNAYHFTPRGAAAWTGRTFARKYRRQLWPDTRQKFPPAAA